MEISGRPTVHPVLFGGAKIAGYFTWLMLAMAMAGNFGLRHSGGAVYNYVIYSMLAAGVGMIIVSSLMLGSSLRIGLPKKKTVLVTRGIYRFTRNPMYLGVHLVTLSALLIVPKWWVVLPGLFSIFAYHQITLGEEQFLEERFGRHYLFYKKQTPRYLIFREENT